jgi:predicted phosphate transport protein (TIGR00153 family)
MRFSFIPKEMKFFEMFDQTTAHITASAAKFLEMIERFDDLPRRGLELKNDEDECDRLVEKIIKALDRSFITPFDREDIHAVATSLDDVMDNMEETAHRFEVFRIGHPTAEAKKLARIVYDCCRHMGSAIALLRDLRKSEQISVHLREIGRFENEADAVYRSVDADLFANANGDLLSLIKWRELYAWLEATVDSTKKVTHILSAIIIKGT